MKFDRVERLVRDYQDKLAQTNYSREYTYYELIYNTTAFEGSQLTESEVVDLLKYGEIVKKKPIEQSQLVQGCYEALFYVIQMSKKKKPLSTKIIQNISAKIMSATGGICKGDVEDYDSSKGEFRRGVVKNAFRLFPDYKRLPSMIEQLCIDTNKRIKHSGNVEEKSILTYDVLYDMMNIYPFGEGNMCAAFLVYNYVQGLCNLPMSFIYKVDGTRFMTICDQARSRGNVHSYHVFCFKQYMKFLEEEIIEMEK